MSLNYRLRLLEHRRPPVIILPDKITIVRGSSDNPRIPAGFFPCDIRIIRLDLDGNRVERLIPAPRQEPS